jgi:hypothetical protein
MPACKGATSILTEAHTFFPLDPFVSYVIIQSVKYFFSSCLG